MRGTRFGIALLAALVAVPAAANWTASGQILYQHREWDSTGFTGAIVNLPVRSGDIEVVDPNKSGPKAILAKGKTDANGNFSIAVTDSTTRAAVRVRALTTTTQTSGLHVKVTTHNGAVYAANSPDATNHNPNTNVNWGTLVAQAFGGAEAFNILDLGIRGADHIKVLTGSWPASNKLVTFKFSLTGGITVSFTSGNTVTLRDTAGYDDTVILHEWAHYAMNVYSKSTNPGGTHFLNDCNEDPRLAFDEARASFFGCSVRRVNGMANANLYVRTNGQSGTGGVQNWYDLETPVQYACVGHTSEVSNSRTMWDISDSAATTDTTPGVDDTPPDALALAESEPWQVFVGPIKNVTYVTAESFWDGWFDPSVANGNLLAMKDIWNFVGIEFFQDAFEPNNATGQATSIVADGSSRHLTYFYDSNGDGRGEIDTDLFSFSATNATSYTAETLNLANANDTNLEILDTNGTTVLASNNDRSAGDKSSLIVWTAPRTDTFYIRSKRASGGFTVYGSYDLKLSSP